MASAPLNKVRNADFRLGASEPRYWTWSGSGRGSGWTRERNRGLQLTAAGPSGASRVEQVIAVKPDTHYRVEVVLTCRVEGSDGNAGVVLSVRPQGRGGAAARSTPPIHTAVEPITIRTYYETGAGVRQLVVGVGIRGATGWAQVEDVCLLEIIEPEHVSHVIAAPPAPWRMAPPLVARTVTVCTEAGDRRLIDLLGRALGPENVRTAASSDPATSLAASQALILPDGIPPRAIRSVPALLRLAADRIVIISTPAFARLARLEASLRTVKQEDDPIHAQVALGGWPTRGFALNDAFAYAWTGRRPGWSLQRQFKRSGAVKTVCQRHGLRTLLRALCNQDATSDRPIAFYRDTERGALVVLDIEPVEEAPTTYGEPALAMYLVLNLLGHTQTHVGQYVVPHPTATDLRTSIRDVQDRLAAWVVHDDDVPVEEVTHQMVTVGSDDASFGLPLKPKPLILVRSGLVSGDVESIYAAFLWFKLLVRMSPDECPYATALGSRFRLAWIPLAAEWESEFGWTRRDRPPALSTTIESDGSPLAAIIDVAAVRCDAARVVVPDRKGRYARYFNHLPELASRLGPPEMFTFDAADGAARGDRTSFAWRRIHQRIEVTADPRLVNAAPLDGSATDRTDVVRIELPAREADLPAHSIRLMDLGVHLLEWVIGLQAGVVAVNRSGSEVTWNGRAIEPGGVLFDEGARKTAVVAAAAESIRSHVTRVQEPA